MAKNLISGPSFAYLVQIGPKFFFRDLPLLDVKYCRKLSLYASWRKMYDSKFKKMVWNLIFGLICGHWTKIRAAIFFFKNLALSVTRYHGQWSNLEKIWWRTDRRREEREWFHRTMSNWRRASNILVENLLFSEMSFVWTKSDLKGIYSF